MSCSYWLWKRVILVQNQKIWLLEKGRNVSFSVVYSKKDWYKNLDGEKWSSEITVYSRLNIFILSKKTQTPCIICLDCDITKGLVLPYAQIYEKIVISGDI